MIKDIVELYIPQVDDKPIATLTSAKVTLMDMAEKTIEADIRIPKGITPDFSADWVLLFRGEKYIMSDKEPQGVNSTDSRSTQFNLTFHHLAVQELKRYLFFTIQPVESGTAVADQYETSVGLNLKEMCDLFSQVLDYYFKGTITIDLNPNWVYAAEPKVVQINNSPLWDVLIQFYTLWAVRWQIVPGADSNHYIIKVGYTVADLSHEFKYGYTGGLLKIERQLQGSDIKNVLNGRGGEKNLPARYFKDVDPNNPTFPADPDWIPELRDVYFDRLRGKSFRDYIKGWKTNPNRQLTEADGTPITPYPHNASVQPIAVEPFDENYAKTNFAYFMGHTDSKFAPIEYVADGYEVVNLKKIQPIAGSSIDRYGVFMGGLANNDEIYPTIQGVEVDPYGRVDEVIWVEPVVKDDYKEASEAEAQIEQLEYQPYPGVAFAPGTRWIGENLGDRQGVYFNVEAGKSANITYNAAVTAYTPDTHADRSTFVQILETQISVYNALNPEESIPPTGIPEGRYFFIAKFKVSNTYSKELNVVCALNDIKLQQADAPDTWRHTFDILIKNIWGTTQNSGESDEQYAARVWQNILGDKAGGEAKIVFSDGMLAAGDYEFVITQTPKVERKLCTWESITNGTTQTNSYTSEWRLTLAKSEADLETLGVYTPSTKRNGKAGDHFFFTGIDMPHQYVLWAEERLDASKTDQFPKLSESDTAYSVTLDRVRINKQGEPNALIEKIEPGATVSLFDKQLIDGGTETLYINSVTITYREPTTNDAALNPDVEMTLSKEYSVAASPVAMLQAEVSAISKQVGAVSNVEQVVRAVGDKLYLRKDAIPDSSLSPTQFYSLLTSGDFRGGMIGGAGWGFFQDASGAWVLETDKVNVRREMQVNNLVINQITARGGMIIESAASMEVAEVERTSDGHYKCYFDTKGGSIANLFVVNDIVMCNRFTPENESLKYYRREVLGIGMDYVVLSGDRADGSGTPAKGDVIVQFGNTTDANRQFAIVRDVIGGGYEMFLDSLYGITAFGREYVFIGKNYGSTARFFVGSKYDNHFIEYHYNKLVISGDVRVLGRSVVDIINDEVSGINVGGTNLFKGSQDWDIKQWRSATTRITPDSYSNPQYYNGTLIGSLVNAYTPYQFIANPVPEEYYTISAWVKSTLDSQIMYFTFLTITGLSDTNISDVINISDQLVKDKWVRVKYTFKMPISNETSLRVGFRFTGVNGSNTFVAGMKLERGNMATDWSKNPQDDTDRFDYLREAMAQNTDIQGGLIQTSSILLGQTNTDGTRTVWAGTNGLFGNNNTLALWSGGNMVDAENNLSSDPRPAKFAVRMNGTGYMAGNTIKFTDSQLKVGNDTILDANGFITTTDNDDGSKSEVVRIANIDMPDINRLLNPTTYSLNKDWTDSSITVEYASTGFNVKFSDNNSVQYVLANKASLPAGAALSMSFSAVIDLSGLGITVPTDPFALYSTPNLLLQIILPSNNSVIYEAQQRITPIGGASQVQVSFDNINTIIPEAGVYALKLMFNGISPQNMSTARKPIVTAMTGQVVSSRSAQTIIAKNGFASVWGQSLLFVNQKYAMLRSGQYGFRVSSTGFQYSVNGTTWKTLNWT